MSVLRLCWILLLCACVVPAQAEELVERFHADIAIQPDGALEVTETIVVRAEGQEIRRGIIREFPTRYRDRHGNHVVVGFEVLGLTRDGQPEPFETVTVGNGVEVLFGDDRFLEVPRSHAYALRYRTTRQLGFFDGFDELYWNVTGNGWIFPIAQASAEIRLPQPVPEGQLALEAYTGPQGAQGRDWTAQVPAPGVARFASSRRLEPYEGLTVSLTFPTGLVARPDGAQKVRWFLQDNAGALVALAGLLVLLAFYLWAWMRHGRDPEAGPAYPRYVAPAGHSPGGVRYLRRMGWDDRCLSADLVDAAVHGCLVIQRDAPTRELLVSAMPEAQRKQVEGSRLMQGLIDLAVRTRGEIWSLRRVEGADTGALSAAQRALLDTLFGEGPVFVLSNTQAERMQRAQRAHRAALAKQYTPGHFVTNTGVVVAGVLWSVAVAVAAIVIGRDAGLVVTVLALGAMVVAHILFAGWLKQPTRQGRTLMDAVEGLRLYLGVAERDDLARLTGPGTEPLLDAARYEALLPYALALEVESAWTARFTAAVGATAAAAAAAGTAWYRGSAGSFGDLGAMSTALGSTFSRQIASAATPPGGSSGSGGGGSSGGGGGGGGGRGR